MTAGGADAARRNARPLSAGWRTASRAGAAEKHNEGAAAQRHSSTRNAIAGAAGVIRKLRGNTEPTGFAAISRAELFDGARTKQL